MSRFTRWRAVSFEDEVLQKPLHESESDSDGDRVPITTGYQDVAADVPGIRVVTEGSAQKMPDFKAKSVNICSPDTPRRRAAALLYSSQGAYSRRPSYVSKLEPLGLSSQEKYPSQPVYNRRPSYASKLGVNVGALADARRDFGKEVSDSSTVTSEIVHNRSSTMRKRLWKDLQETQEDELDTKGGIYMLYDKFSVDELAAKLYKVLDDVEDMPNFVENIKLDPDGGLDRIENLWNPTKVLWCMILLVSVVLNAVCLLCFNWNVSAIVVGVLLRNPLSLLQVLWMSLSGKGTSTLEKVVPEFSEEQATTGALNTLTAGLFAHLGNDLARARFLTVATFVATFEVCMMIVYLIVAAQRLCWFCNPLQWYDDYTSWHGIVLLLHDTLPRLSTFSALRLFVKVHPSLIYEEYMDIRGHYAEEDMTWIFNVWIAACFIVTRVMSALMALGAFAIKVTALGFKLSHPQTSWVISSFYLISLMNQCMNSVLLESVLQDRIFLFIFGGQDTDYRVDEKALRNVYQCRLAKQIWIDFWQRGSRLKALVLMSTLDHYDLQRLLIEDVNDHFDSFSDPENDAFPRQNSVSDISSHGTETDSVDRSLRRRRSKRAMSRNRTLTRRRTHFEEICRQFSDTPEGRAHIEGIVRQLSPDGFDEEAEEVLSI